MQDEDPNAFLAGLGQAHNLNPLAYAGRCIKLTAAGTRCKSNAITGGDVCMRHGGGNPHIVAAARLRLMTLIDPAISVLADEMQNAEKSADRRLAAVAILDRAGVGPKAETDDGNTRELLKARILAVQGQADVVADVPAVPYRPQIEQAHTDGSPQQAPLGRAGQERAAAEEQLNGAVSAAVAFATPHAPKHSSATQYRPQDPANLPAPQIITTLEQISGHDLPHDFYYDDEDD